MNKYIGKYRVVCEFDRETLKPIKEDTYIVCNKDGQIYRINNNTLAYYKPHKGNSKYLIDKLTEIGVYSIENNSSDEDILIYFNENYLDKVAKEVGAFISGLDIAPTSIKNLRKLKWFKDNKQKYIDNGLYKPKQELNEEEKAIFRERFLNIRNVNNG